jgi:hypothetical protein
MLLGPGEFLDFRRKVKEELVQKGYDVVIMEELSELETDSSLDEKFERIVRKYDPFLFIAFFHKDADMRGVIFEVGFISCYYKTVNIGEKLAFLGDKDYSWNNYAPAYITTSLSKIRTANYDEGDIHYKASQKIHYFVSGTLNKDSFENRTRRIFSHMLRLLRLNR